MPSYLRTTAGGKSISGGSLAPKSDRYNAGSVATNALGVLTLDLPVLAAAAAANAAFTVVISNYDATVTYTLSTNAGSVARSTNTITQSGLSASGAATITVTATKDGFTSSAPATRAGNAAAGCSCVYQYTAVEGGNCGTPRVCGTNQVCCYNIDVYSPSFSPCTGVCNHSVGGWYACDGTC